jgi:hypothetical protein
MSGSTARLTTLAECAYRVNQLCRPDRVKVEARRLVTEVQADQDEHSGGESDWEKRRRVYFEETAMADDELLDRASHYNDRDLQWQPYEREVQVADVAGLPPRVRREYFNPLPDYYYRRDTPPSEHQPAGSVQIHAWAPVEFLKCNRPNHQFPLPPSNIGREYRFVEIVTALVAIHDADGRFEPIVCEEDPISKHWLFSILRVGIVNGKGTDEWAQALEPLFERVEAEWSKLVESDTNSETGAKKRSGREVDDQEHERRKLVHKRYEDFKLNYKKYGFSRDTFPNAANWMTKAFENMDF